MTTEVTTALVTRIARHFRAQVVNNLLVGFKYIAEVLWQLESTGRYEDVTGTPADFIIASEESHGILAMPQLRDKDSAAACLLLAELALERNLWVVSDECYEPLTYDGRHVSIASLSPEVKARTIVVNTCSKAYAMTGWRIGYAAGPKPVIKAMTDVQSQVTSNPTSIAQWAAVEALAGPQDEVAKMAGEFDRRRRVIIDALNAIPGVRCVMPKGAFYAFPNVAGLFGRRSKSGILRGSAGVCAFLLDEARIATVAGVDFGSDAHIRLSYATGLETIREGLSRMDTAVRALAG